LTNARLRARQDAAQIAAAPEDELLRFLAQVHHALASAGPLSEKARAHAPLSVAAAAQATACAFYCTQACAHATSRSCAPGAGTAQADDGRHRRNAPRPR